MSNGGSIDPYIKCITVIQLCGDERVDYSLKYIFSKKGIPHVMGCDVGQQSNLLNCPLQQMNCRHLELCFLFRCRDKCSSFAFSQSRRRGKSNRRRMIATQSASPSSALTSHTVTHTHSKPTNSMPDSLIVTCMQQTGTSL